MNAYLPLFRSFGVFLVVESMYRTVPTLKDYTYGKDGKNAV